MFRNFCSGWHCKSKKLSKYIIFSRAASRPYFRNKNKETVLRADAQIQHYVCVFYKKHCWQHAPPPVCPVIFLKIVSHIINHHEGNTGKYRVPFPLRSVLIFPSKIIIVSSYFASSWAAHATITIPFKTTAHVRSLPPFNTERQLAFAPSPYHFAFHRVACLKSNKSGPR